MPYQLRYKYAQGDVITYDIFVTHEIKEPEGESLESLMAIRSTTTVEVAEPNRFVCVIQTEAMDSEGLAALAPTTIQFGVGRYSHDARGEMLPTPGAPPTQLLKNMGFPERGLDPGEGWEHSEPAGDGKATIYRVRLEEIIEQDGESVAVLSTVADLQTGDPEVEGKLESRFHFSLTRGRRLWSRTSIESTWSSGRRVSSVTEVHPDLS